MLIQFGSTDFTLGRGDMRTTIRLFFLLVLGLAAWPAGAGEVIGNTYVGERFGYIELTAPDGKWEITDKEKGATNDMAGMIAHFKLKDAISGWRADVNILGFKKIEDAITVDFVMNTMRTEWTAQGGETEAIETGRIAGKKVFFYDKRLNVKGIAMKGRDIYLEGGKAVFVVHMIVRADVYPQTLQLLEELVAGAKY